MKNGIIMDPEFHEGLVQVDGVSAIDLSVHIIIMKVERINTCMCIEKSPWQQVCYKEDVTSWQGLEFPTIAQLLSNLLKG